MKKHAALATLGLVLAVVAAPGCRTRSIRSGTLSCSCSGTGCSCRHCSAEGAECNCRATDAYGGHTNVGDPDRGEPGSGD